MRCNKNEKAKFFSFSNSKNNFYHFTHHVSCGNKYYLKHQEEVVTRRTKYDLNKAEERDHILQGLLIALDNIDEVIKIIRGSANTQVAKENLINRFGKFLIAMTS